MEESKEVSVKREFLYQSISDIQGIIRAIDTKFGFLLIILLFPITHIGEISRSIKSLHDKLNTNFCEWLLFIIVILFVFSWIFAFYIAFKGIISIENPISHIRFNEHKASGTFYSGGLFSLKIRDAICNRKIQASKTFDEHLKDLSQNDDNIFQELAFEQMKLVYIRDMKIHRQTYACFLTLFWLSLGFIIWMWKLFI